MDKLSFGMTMLIVGMGGTLATLTFMSLVMVLLKRLVPYKGEEEGK